MYLLVFGLLYGISVRDDQVKDPGHECLKCVG